MNRSILFTGISPTGTLTLGNYCGIISHLLSFQNEYNLIIMIADLHAMTIPKKGFNYREESEKMAALLYSCGLKKKNTKIFIQSEISEHLELFFFLSSLITVGKLGDMIQYKEKKKKDDTGNLSLLQYPVLMAADIFLYDVDRVIIGEDQKQHLELTSFLFKKFINISENNILKMPNFFVSERFLGSKILSLKHPTKKMSKSDKEGCLFLLDGEQEIKKKIMKAETDSENKIYYDPEKKPGVSNLLILFSVLTNKDIKEVENLFIGSSYFFLKKELVNVIQKKFFYIQNEYEICLKNIKLLLEKDNVYFKNKASKKMLDIKRTLFLKNL